MSTERDAQAIEAGAAGELVSEEIEVERDGLTPLAFIWRDQRYEVAEVLRMWFDTKFGPTTSRIRRGWWERRHRTYYRLRTATGERFDIYWDRSSIGRRWFLYRRLPADLPEAAGGETS
jgi:hypothetical protein